MKPCSLPASLLFVCSHKQADLLVTHYELRVIWVLLLAGLLSQIRAIATDPVVFTLDPARSHISISGNVTVSGLGSYAFQQQGAGSLTASYSGSIPAELDPPSIRFPGGSVIEAKNSGSWQPGIGGVSGNAPADYGIVIRPPFTTANSAIRNIQLDLSGPGVLVTNGGFDAGQLVTTYLTNATPPPSTDFLVSSLAPSLNTNGTSMLAGTGTNSPSTAYLTNGAGLLILVLPVSTTNTSTVGGDPATVILQGQIVATAPASAWPLLVSIQVQAGQITLTWPSLPGQSFAVQTKPDLNASWSAAAGTMTVHPNTTTWTTGASEGTGFYRVAGSY